MKQAAPLVALVLSLVLVSTADAKRPTPEQARREAEARQHYQTAMTHYDLGEFDTAIDEFKLAYKVSDEPGLLFNIAQAYRLKKDWQHAREFYERYLGLVPDAANRADVEAQLAKIRAEEESEAQPAPPAPVAAPVVTPPAPLPAVAASPPVPRPRFLATRRGRATVALATIAGASAVLAGVAGGLSLSMRADYDRRCDRGACDGALFDSGRRLAITTDVAIGVAVVAGTAALVLALTRPRTREIRVGWAF